MDRSAKKAIFNVLYIAVVIGLALSVWAVGAAVADSEFILPNISETFNALGQVLTLRSFWSGLGSTLVRSIVGFVLSVVIFAVLFYLSTAYYSVRRIVDPIVSALRTLPTVAVALILAIWAGGYGAPVILSVLVIMPILYSAMRAKISTVPTELKEICFICGAGKWSTFRALWFPYTASALPESLSSAFSYNIKAVLGAEILVSTKDSLGMLMQLSKAYLQTAMLIAMTLAAVVVSVVSELLLRKLLCLAFRRYRD